MNVLLLSPYPEKLIEALIKEGDNILIHNDDINIDFLNKNSVDFIVSYGYSRVIKREIIENFKNSIINLHISYLPYNRGSYPNLWSFIDGTPAGITIHKIDEGIDTGQILFQKKIIIDTQKNTFRTSYITLRKEIEIMFYRHWKDIKNQNYKEIKSNEKGTFYLKKEGQKILSKLKLGWDTNIEEGLIEIKKNLKNNN